MNWGACAAGLPCTGYTIPQCNDCADLQETFSHATRGGSNTDAPKNIRASLRDSTGSYEAVNDVGFRCARVP